MAEAEPGRDRIIQELITHINSLEQKINMLKEELSEANDLQTVNRLDIINLKNEIEKIKISVPVLAPDIADRIKGMEKLMEKQDHTGSIQKMIGDMEQLKKAVRGISPETIEEMQSEISALYEMVSRRQPQEQAGAQPSKEVAELKKQLAELEIKAVPVPHCSKCGAVLKPGARFCGRCGKKL
ncbi:MAG: zinc-ribbon domain-containing protein [Candidatus Aenigmarchaeota archaeon]|nr:zinc-ribbon domain-containing protein [Candidatus Aenigmarchaeota archaeon]